DRLHRPKAAHVTDDRMLRLHRAHALIDLLTELRGLLPELRSFRKRDCFERRRTGDRIAGVCSAERTGIGRVHDAFATDDRPERISARERLGDGHEIGFDAVMLDRPHLAGTAEARLYFVGDEHDAILGRDLAKVLEESLRWNEKAAF